MNEIPKDESEVRYCKHHPRAETRVSCAGCGQPICLKCMISTPVGYKCRECAQMRRLPQYALTPRLYARVIPGALALAFGVGFLLSYALFLGLFGGLIVGLVVSAGLKRLSGYKQGPEMEIIAGCTVVLAIVSGPLLAELRLNGLAHFGATLQGALSTQVIGSNALGIIVGVYIAVQQLR